MRLAEELRAMGHTVEEYVLRIDGVLFIYLPSGKWRDVRNGEHGRIHLASLAQFVQKRLGSNHDKALPNLSMR